MSHAFIYYSPLLCTLCSILKVMFCTCINMYPADDGAAMEAEVTNIPALWHQHAGVRQCTEMARTLRWRRKE